MAPLVLADCYGFQLIQCGIFPTVSHNLRQRRGVQWQEVQGSSMSIEFPHESKHFLIFSDIVYVVLATTSTRTFRLLPLKQREIPKTAANGKSGLLPFGRFLISNFYVFFDSLPILLLWANLYFPPHTSLWGYTFHKSINLRVDCCFSLIHQ